jgi:hypothetical protein
MMRRALLLAIVLLSFACADRRDEVTLAFDENDRVTITTSSPLADNWEHRFARIEPSSEKVTIEKAHGKVANVTHSANVAADDLQKFFSDVDVTIQLTRGQGFTELAIYPGASSRATRAERDELTRRVHVAAVRMVDYVNATRHLYDYLDLQPGRAESVFTQLFADKDEDILAASEEENALILAERRAMERVSATAPEESAQQRFVELAQRVNDPLPGVITVKLPRAYAAAEGFKRIDDATLRAEVTSPGEALAGLEGRWVSPDPLADVFAKDKVDPLELAHAPRRAELAVTADEIAGAFIAQLKPKAVYRVRWAATTE